jgi:hypothetical protein
LACGGVQGVTFEYFYLNVVEEDAADNEVVRIVIEDTIDADGNGVRRTVWGINVTVATSASCVG